MIKYNATKYNATKYNATKYNAIKYNARTTTYLSSRAAKIVLLLGLSGPLLNGCTAIAVVDAAASTAVGVSKAAVGVTTTAVKGTAAVAGAVIPDGDNKKKSKK